MGFFGGGEIGLSEEVVSNLLTQSMKDSQEVVTTLGSQMQAILNKLGEEWGTQESIENVENNIKPGLVKAQAQVAAELKAIGDTIRSTAIQQAADTNNDFSGLPAVTTATVVGLDNKQQAKLPSGYVGVVSSLEKDVASASTQLVNEVNSKLNTLRRNVTDLAKKAFLDEGKTVATKSDQYIEQVNAALKNALENLLEQVKEYTVNVVKYEQNIQGEWVQVNSETVA